MNFLSKIDTPSSKTIPLSSVLASKRCHSQAFLLLKIPKRCHSQAKSMFPRAIFLQKQNTLKRNLIFPGHFPHGRFRAVDSPRFPRGSPQTVVNEGFSTKKQAFGSFFGTLGEFPVLEPESYQTI